MRLETEKRSDERDLDFEGDELDTAAEAFRYERDLITAEETEQWLAARSLTLDDFTDYFNRQCWGTKLEEEIEIPATPYVNSSGDLRQLFAAELILSGDVDWLTTNLMWRLAAAKAEKEVTLENISTEKENFFSTQGIESPQLAGWLEELGRDAAWFDEMATMEAAYHQRCGGVLVPNALKHELGSLRLPLTRFETEVIEVESLDAAHEAAFCVTEDGMSMQEVASEGRYPFRELSFLLEDLSSDVQQMFMSISPGDLLNPISRGDGFELCRVIRKIEPNAEDPAVKQRVEGRLLDRHFDELTGRHVERRLGAIVPSE
jgi:hypothetical protein